MANTNDKPQYGPVLQWIEDRTHLVSAMDREYGRFPMPRNCNYFWSFGGAAMFMLITMIITGIILAMHYVAEASIAFDRIEHIMRDVNFGWLFRYLHMNGASFFFIAVYIHIFRGLYFGSYQKPRELLWMLGVVILLLMMATAFIGYVLPWGQMSLWGANVITNLFSAVPLAGDQIVTWIWGGFSVGDQTLNRFFALHYLLPFVILGVVILHVVALHVVGSNNPTGLEPKTEQDTLPFHPYFTSKDIFGLSVFVLFFVGFVFYAPNYLGHPDNYIPADPLNTPPHIVPEWYFLPFYAILRSIESKFWGVVAMFGAIAVLFFLPWLDGAKVKSARFRPIYSFFFLLFVVDCFFLGYVGAMPAEEPWITYARLGTGFYFAFFLIILPVLSRMEKARPLPPSIYEHVMKSKKTSKAVG